MNNNIMREAMTKAGIEVSEQFKKVERQEQTLQHKFNAAYSDIKFIRRYIDKYSGAPDEIEKMCAADGLATRVNGLTQFIKEMGDNIAKSKGITLESGASLSHSIRKIEGEIDILGTEMDVLDKLKIRNEMIHDYVNTNYYKIKMADFFLDTKNIDTLEKVINKIKDYICKQV